MHNWMTICREQRHDKLMFETYRIINGPSWTPLQIVRAVATGEQLGYNGNAFSLHIYQMHQCWIQNVD